MTLKEQVLGLPICIVLALFMVWLYKQLGFDNPPNFLTFYCFWYVIILSGKVHILWES